MGAGAPASDRLSRSAAATAAAPPAGVSATRTGTARRAATGALPTPLPLALAGETVRSDVTERGLHRVGLGFGRLPVGACAPVVRVKTVAAASLAATGRPRSGQG